jgi:hypothetical protein
MADVPDAENGSDTISTRWKVLSIAALSTAAIVACLVILHLGSSSLESPAASADAMSSIGFSCRALPDQGFTGSMFTRGISCSDEPVAVVFIYWTNPSGDPEEFQQTLSRLDERCSDEVPDQGDFLYGPEQPVWVEVSSPNSSATSTVSAPRDLADQIARTLGVTLQHC